MSKIEENFVNQIKYLGDQMSDWNKNSARYLPIVEQLEALGSEPSFSCWVYAGIIGNRDKLIKAIRILRTSGLKSCDIPKEGSSTFSSWYHNEDHSLGVFLSFSSTVCRRVKVGTKTETVDVYAVECGEDPAEPASPSAMSDDVPF
jgi:hypothetical protein